MERIYLSSPHLGTNERLYVKEAFDTNWVAPLGPNVEEFEKSIESYLGNDKKVAALSSGTAAIHLALILLGVTHGDTVLCQSMTFSASANPIIYQGAIPIFIDSEPTTWNMCPEALETAIKKSIKNGRKPKAIIAVHLYGMPYQVEDIRNISKTYEIPIIEDSAEALGSHYKNTMCGTFGDLSILSFNGNKIITTSGGGALVSNTQEEKDKTVFLATQARDKAPHYQHSHIGYNYRLSNICAGIGRGQMEVLNERVAQRRKNQQRYQNIFKDWEGIEVFSEPNSNFYSNHWLTCIRFNSKKTNLTPTQVRLEFEKFNIESRPLWKPMHLQPIFNDADYIGGTIASDIFDTGLCLPSGSNLTESNWERIESTINSLAR